MKKTLLTLVAAAVAILFAAGSASAEPTRKAVQDTTAVKAATGMRTVVLKDAGESKVKVIKVLREYLGLGLKETHALVNDTPVVLKKGVPASEAESISASLTALGAKVEIREE